MAKPAEELKAEARSLGFDGVGVCRADAPAGWDAYRKWIEKRYHGEMDYLRRHLPLKRHPQELLAGVRSIVAVRLNYNQPNPVHPGYPRIARYALGRDYHKVLRSKLNRLAKWIQLAKPGAKARVCVDTAPILEREFAQQAGLGWFGKNTCLIDSKAGSWFFIGLLLTTVEYEADSPAIGSCGTCRKCVEACPTGAIVFEEDRWQLDARRCISYLTIEHQGPIPEVMAPAVGDWTFGCDVCQEVCPFNEPRATQPHRAPPTEETDFGRREWPALEDLICHDEVAWDVLTRGSAVRRAGFEGLRRNARVNLANRAKRSGDP